MTDEGLSLLVTGAAGFVGQAVMATARDRGHRATGVDRRTAPVPTGTDLETGDIRDAATIARLAIGRDAIIHCAAVVGPGPATADPKLATEINVDGTLAVLEAARQTGGNIVNLSTATLYGHRPDLAPLDEHDRPDPIGIYDATKLMAETLCLAYRRSFGISVASFRTGFVYGASHSTGDYLVERLVRGERRIREKGADHPCDFTYVDDLAKGLVLAAEAGALPEPVYNLTGGCLRTRGDLATIVGARFPTADIEQVPGVDPDRHLRGVCRIERAAKDFGYRPDFTLEAGIEDWLDRIGMGATT